MLSLDIILPWAGNILIVIGAVFMFFAALSLVRMPDLYIRMSASTKAATLGVGLVLLGAASHFANTDGGASLRALAVIVFIFLTAPVSAHMIARAAYFNGEPMWEGTLIDEWELDNNPKHERERLAEEL
jgi:multicomponent Na+:H+ antiporter subunit G